MGNKVRGKIQREYLKKFAVKNGLEILDFVPFDQNVVELEMRGETPLKNRDSTAVRAIQNLSGKLITNDN